MKVNNLIPEEVSLYEKIVSDSCTFSPEGRCLLRSALISASYQAASVFLYTCEPYVFLVGFINGSYFALDTHPIGERLGGDGNGLLTVFAGTDSKSCDSLCHWIWTRLAEGAVKGDGGQSLSEVIRTSPVRVSIKLCSIEVN